MQVSQQMMLAFEEASKKYRTPDDVAQHREEIVMKFLREEKKGRILKELQKAFNQPRISQSARLRRKTGMSDITASTYLRTLEAERKILVSRKVGKAVFYRLKK